MKKLLFLSVLIIHSSVLLFNSASAQAPSGFTYQSVLRDANNDLIINTAVGTQISILQTTSTGTAVYVETHAETTNANGLLTLQVGAGSVQSGTFANIDWSAGPYFVKAETDPAGGATYTITGTQQMMSVPYALYAETSGTGGGSTALEDADADTKIQVEESADEDIIRFDIEGTERWVMQGARLEPTNTGNSVFIGQGAGANDDLTDNQNVFVGDSAGYSNTTGYENTANGGSALRFNTTGYYNTANGGSALRFNTTGTLNTASGSQALYYNTTGYYNTANGRSALFFNTTGYENTANGSQALYYNTTGTLNAASGYRALQYNTTGSSNTALGSYANVATGGLTNATAIGANATVNASNKIQLGDANVTAINTSGTYTGAGFVKAGGTATEFLMADGSVSTGLTACSLSIGDTYQGGIIFYLDPSGCHGLIAAPNDQGTNIQWWNGSYLAIGAYGSALFEGQYNTILINNHQGGSTSATAICDNLSLGGYNDWYLPSIEELKKMHQNIGQVNALGLGNIANFANSTYWSSTETYNGVAAWRRNFSITSSSTTGKEIAYYVRAIRAF